MTDGAKVTEQSYTLLPTDEGETLVIPAVRIRLVMVFVTFWFVVWTAIGLGSVLTTEFIPLNGFMVMGAVFWIFAWIYAGSLLLWMFTGREIFWVRGDDFEVTRTAFALSRKLVYHVPAMRDLRVEPRPWLGAPRGGVFPFLGNSRFGAVRFSYRGWTQDFALGLKEDDAREILDWVLSGLSRAEGGGDRARHDL